MGNHHSVEIDDLFDRQFREALTPDINGVRRRTSSAVDHFKEWRARQESGKRVDSQPRMDLLKVPDGDATFRKRSHSYSSYSKPTGARVVDQLVVMPFAVKAASVDEDDDRHATKMRTSSSGALNLIALQQIAQKDSVGNTSSKASGSSASLTIRRLGDATDDDMRLFKMSWRRAVQFSEARNVDLGIMIFSNILSVHPELRLAFEVDPDLTLDQVADDSKIRRHARVFINMIDLVVRLRMLCFVGNNFYSLVRNSNDLERQVQTALVTYGRRHYFKHHVDFRADYLTSFARAILTVVRDINLLIQGEDPLLECAWNQNVAEVWQHVIVYVIKQMKAGFDDEAAHDPKGKRLSKMQQRHSADYTSQSNHGAVDFLRRTLNLGHKTHDVPNKINIDAVQLH